eukprot:scaffold16.g69.t1
MLNWPYSAAGSRTEAYDTSVDKEGRPVPLHGKKSEREERWAALCTNGSLGSLLSLVNPFNMPAGARRPLLPSGHHTHSNSCPCCWLEPDNWSADEDMSAHLSAQLPLELDDCEGKWEPGDYLSADRLHTVEDERQTRRARAAARAAATLRAPAAQQQVLLAQQLQEMQGRQRPPHRRFSLFSSAPNLSDSLDLAPREDSAAAFGSEFAAPR